jgi:hypothetical protein
MSELRVGGRDRLDIGDGRMSRLKRFEDHRFIGDRRTMIVYDCNDAEQLAVLEALVAEHGLDFRNQLQTFAPDELPEAMNRSFTGSS